MEQQRMQAGMDAHLPVSSEAGAPGAEGADHSSPECLLHVIHAVAVLNGRWAPPILANLYVLGEPTRFGELHRRIQGISQKELARHLANLVTQGVLRRQEQAGAVRYSLTQDGLRLLGRMKALGEWSRDRDVLAGRRDANGARRPASWIDPVLR